MRSLARRLLRLCRCPEGAAVLEFGIVAPVLIMIMMGVVEFGRLHWVRNSIEYAAEQTARWAIVNTAASDEQIKAHAKAEFDDVSAGKAKVNVTRDTANGLNFLTVIVTYDFQFLADFAGIGTLSLRSETRVPLI